ncbi:MAG TPA: ParB/RepB/Spo0J family partition protein [Pyrinomonadaceae bacterium]|jgi:ParB family chromosome partitioning protein
MNRKPLGRGLSALISTAPSPQENEELREIEIDLIRPGEQQPRNSFDEAKLQELAQSIRASGIIQPLLVRRRGGLFELVAGERRWRAAQLAGLTRVPAIVRDIPDENLLELALIENIQRQELNPIEEANAYRRLIESLRLTQEEVAQRVGRDRTFITNYLRILKLPTEIQSLLEQEKLTFGHARALLGVSDPQMQRRLAQRIHKNNWSVRETENRIRNLTSRQPSATPPAHRLEDPNLRAAEAKLRRRFGTQVRIVAGRPGTAGRIEIEFYSPEDLNRLYDLLTSSDQQMVASASTG